MVAHAANGFSPILPLAASGNSCGPHKGPGSCLSSTTVCAGVPQSLLLLTSGSQRFWNSEAPRRAVDNLLEGPHFLFRPHQQMDKQINLFLSLIIKLIPAYLGGLPWQSSG